MSILRLLVLSIFTLLMLHASLAAAERTEITVRVLAKGAKFVGSSMGGVTITIRDAVTGELLATGVTRGTGNTRAIMTQEHKRGTAVSTPDAAKFSAALELEEPRLVEISAHGPRAQQQAAARASVTQWLVPGRHVTGGDGVVLELPGFVVDVLAPGAHASVKPGKPGKVRVNANVRLMCGCPITPGGLWDASKYTVQARVQRDGKLIGEVPLRYAGKTSQFTATIDARQPGTYLVAVYAYDPKNGNTGLDMTSFVVE
jgi:hypothetical protein